MGDKSEMLGAAFILLVVNLLVNASSLQKQQSATFVHSLYVMYACLPTKTTWDKLHIRPRYLTNKNRYNSVETNFRICPTLFSATIHHEVNLGIAEVVSFANNNLMPFLVLY